MASCDFFKCGHENFRRFAHLKDDKFRNLPWAHDKIRRFVFLKDGNSRNLSSERGKIYHDCIKYVAVSHAHTLVLEQLQSSRTPKKNILFTGCWGQKRHPQLP